MKRFLEELIASEVKFELTWEQELIEIEPTASGWRQYESTGLWWVFGWIDNASH